MALPHAETAYLTAVVARLRELLGDDLVGVYPTGSVALDGYRPGRSDLDLVAVAEQPSTADVAAIAAALRHDVLPCPATGLEFVLYDRAALAGLATEDGFSLNLNTGRELPSLVEAGPAGRPGYWYPIDRDITAQQDRALTGPAFTSLTTRVPYARLLPVVVTSVAANLDPATTPGGDAVLNGCRALRYGERRDWTAKPEAGRWARTQAPAYRDVIDAALTAHDRDRAADRTVDPDAARAFLARVHHRLTAGSSP